MKVLSTFSRSEISSALKWAVSVQQYSNLERTSSLKDHGTGQHTWMLLVVSSGAHSTQYSRFQIRPPGWYPINQAVGVHLQSKVCTIARLIKNLHEELIDFLYTPVSLHTCCSYSAVKIVTYVSWLVCCIQEKKMCKKAKFLLNVIPCVRNFQCMEKSIQMLGKRYLCTYW